MRLYSLVSCMSFLPTRFGISAGVAAGIMFVTTLWDAINDPIINTMLGIVSQLTTSSTTFPKATDYRKQNSRL